MSNAMPLAIAAVIAVFLLIAVWKLVTGAAKMIVMLVLVAAIIGVLAWMGKGGA